MDCAGDALQSSWLPLDKPSRDAQSYGIYDSLGMVGLILLLQTHQIICTVKNYSYNYGDRKHIGFVELSHVGKPWQKNWKRH